MGQRVTSYFADGVGSVVAFLPHLLSALIILAVGWGVAVLLRAIAVRLLHGVHFDRLVEHRVHRKATSKGSPTNGVGAIVYWITLLVATTMASRALGLDTLAVGLSRILGYLPHVLVACAIVIVGAAVGRLVGNLVAEVASRMLATIARGAVLALAIFMALDELQVAHGIVMTTFSLLLGAAAIAAAVAFGFGNRELAGQYTRNWIRRAEDQPRGDSFEAPAEPPLGGVPPATSEPSILEAPPRETQH
jgi:hypothetical protein